MTNEEALKVINRNLVVAMQDWDDPTDEYQREQAEGLQKAKEALEKQIPKKPIDITVKELFSSMISGRCPKCNTRQSYGSRDWHRWFNKRCFECGQALDWSEGE